MWGLRGMRRNRKIIVITGGIASGKSTVANYLQEKGYKVIDSDRIVHQLYEKGSDTYKALIGYFGEEILDNCLEINRKILSRIIFFDEKKREALQNIVHKRVIIEINRLMKEIQDDIIFLDIPLVIEEQEKLKKYGLYYDELWLIYTTKALQIERLLQRDSRGEEESVRIINSQMSLDHKREYADEIIENTSSLDKLKNIVDNLLQKIDKKSSMS